MNKNNELTPEEIARFEEVTGTKVIDASIPLIEYKGKRWRPIKSDAEVMCAMFDHEPILQIGETPWVGENWKP